MPATFRETLNAILQSKVADPATTLGTLISAIAQTWTGIHTFVAQVVFGSSTSTDTVVVINGAAGGTRDIRFQTGLLNRWLLRGANATAETGANAGSDFQIVRRADDGTNIQNALVITRSNGNWSFGDTTANPSYTFLGTGPIASNGTIRLKGYTVAGLPAGTTGDTAYVTNALAPAFGVAVAGGGAVVVPVFYNGAAWICA